MPSFNTHTHNTNVHMDKKDKQIYIWEGHYKGAFVSKTFS
jgi:hypothetical protein